MKKYAFAFAFLFLAQSALAVKVGDKAPAFTGKDVDKKTVSLADFKNKYVVLEWHNKDCPFVVAHYKNGAMQKLQKKWTGKGVAWLSIVSSAEGQEGYVSEADGKRDMKDTGTAPNVTMILDPLGKIGHDYEAETTPHMFIIDPSGKLIYNGAIDNEKDKKRTKEINYVEQALTESLENHKEVSQKTVPPYGCGVKYEPKKS